MTGIDLGVVVAVAKSKGRLHPTSPTKTDCLEGGGQSPKRYNIPIERVTFNHSVGYYLLGCMERLLASNNSASNSRTSLDRPVCFVPVLRITYDSWGRTLSKHDRQNRR